MLKNGNLFLVANRLGDVAPAGARDLGLFLTDTRHLSAWRLAVDGGPPLCLSTQVSFDYTSQIDFTITGLHEGDLLGKEPVNYVHLRREQLIEDVFVDRLVLTNYQGRSIREALELRWAADFADVFEIRGAHRARRGRYLAPDVAGDRVRLRYLGLDGREYLTQVTVELAGADGEARRVAVERLDGAGARIVFRLEPGESGEVAFSVLAAIGAPPVPSRRAFATRTRDNASAYQSWADRCTRFESSHELFDQALVQGIADFKALQVHHGGEPVISAGIPWYTCPFGRDALIAGFEALLATPEVARDALRFLARLQGTRDDPARDEEPGKIPHEVRFGEMAAAGEVPHAPYYGSVDATPLFVVLLSEYLQWTDDRALLEELLPSAERAMAWIEGAGAHSGGLLTYQRRTPHGLRNQGWKDSHDGVPFASGRPADPPIALVEAQGYAIDARRRLARMLRAAGRHDDAARLLADARALTQQVEARFWMPARETYALALDGAGRQVDAVTSNPGHLLFSRAVTEPRARAVTASLLSPALWSGWGIRTLAKGQPAYNPLSYHDGTVWPHDNAIAALGMACYGLTRSAGRVLDGLWAAAQQFRHLRLPELFCGLDRQPGQFPVHYPVACSPQAWASGALFLLVRACLGLFPDASRRTLHIASPALPAWLDRLTLHRLRVGPARVTLHFTRNAGGTFVGVGEVENGPLQVRIDLQR